LIISDISVKRPIFALVISLLIISFGIISFDRLPLREYPDTNPPVVSIETLYPGANSSIVERKITQLIEDRISGIEGVKSISSSSKDGASKISIEFKTTRDVDSAANDVRDRVSRIADEIPSEAFAPEIFKVDSNENVMMWLNLSSEVMDGPALTDYATRYLVDQLSQVDGVGRVRIGGGRTYALRIWVRPLELSSRGLTSSDIEAALRNQNLELPAGM
jgi:multidrug efflux pump